MQWSQDYRYSISHLLKDEEACFEFGKDFAQKVIEYHNKF